jgi:hypothetical protein
MAVSKPYRTTPQLGPQLDEVFTWPYWDTQLGISDGSQAAGTVSPSYLLGDKEVGNDGHDYVWVKASAGIAAAGAPGTQVTITEPAFTAATGAGGYYAPVGGVLINQYFHARKGANGAP